MQLFIKTWPSFHVLPTFDSRGYLKDMNCNRKNSWLASDWNALSCMSCRAQILGRCVWCMVSRAVLRGPAGAGIHDAPFQRSPSQGCFSKVTTKAISWIRITAFSKSKRDTWRFSLDDVRNSGGRALSGRSVRFSTGTYLQSKWCWRWSSASWRRSSVTAAVY